MWVCNVGAVELKIEVRTNKPILSCLFEGARSDVWSWAQVVV